MKHLFIILGSLLLLTGCNLYKNYERPAQYDQLEPLYRDTASVDGMLPAGPDADTVNFGNTPWRDVFCEPELQQLIEKALANNPDMKKAELNIHTAQQGLKVSKLSYIPSLAFAPQGEVTSYDLGKATTAYGLPLAATWNLGSWGSLRNTRKQSQVVVLQTKAAQHATRTALIAGVANLYYTLQMLDAQLATTKSTIAIWKRNVEVMEAMREAGMTNDAAVAQTKANYIELQASVPSLENSIRSTENALCVLLDEPSHPIVRQAFNADNFPASLNAGVPAQLLANRPDVRIAELNLAHTFYGVNIARSAFYPSLTITGTAAWTDAWVFQGLASLTQPLFANGKLRANLRIKKNEYEAAAIDFRDAVLKAGQEVSNALHSYQTAIARQQHREEEIQVLTMAMEKIEYLFQHTNTTSYLETLTAQQSLLSAQLSLINDKYDKVQAAINLYKALGGGRE